MPKQFTTIPTGGEEVRIPGKNISMYTSEQLKNNVKKASKKYLNSRVSSIIETLIDSKRLIPIFKSKNIIQYLKNRRKGTPMGSHYKGIIYIYLDAHYSLFKLSSINEKELAITILHELIHLAKEESPKQFFELNKRYIDGFYKIFFSDYLNVNIKDISDKMISDISKKYVESDKKGYLNFRNIYLPFFKSLEKYTNLSDEEYGERFRILIDYLDEIYEKFTPYIPTQIKNSADKAYIKIAGKTSNTFAQEFWLPDEIISVISELNPKHPSVERSITILRKVIKK